MFSGIAVDLVFFVGSDLKWLNLLQKLTHALKNKHEMRLQFTSQNVLTYNSCQTENQSDIQILMFSAYLLRPQCVQQTSWGTFLPYKWNQGSWTLGLFIHYLWLMFAWPLGSFESLKRLTIETALDQFSVLTLCSVPHLVFFFIILLFCRLFYCNFLALQLTKLKNSCSFNAQNTEKRLNWANPPFLQGIWHTCRGEEDILAHWISMSRQFSAEVEGEIVVCCRHYSLQASVMYSVLVMAFMRTTAKENYCQKKK